jgi:hypothetical protein
MIVSSDKKFQLPSNDQEDPISNYMRSIVVNLIDDTCLYQAKCDYIKSTSKVESDF